jgi:hypothetical protein|tara:strand:- start:916 stop:1227 length:312 start_codon:yes stop_codon:yes gene_type:complete
MAFINIKKASVNRIIEGYGFEAVNNFTDRSGTERQERFTVWTKDEVPTVGQVMDISGIVSAKVEEFEKDGEMIRYAGIHVNNPRLTLLEDAPSPSPALEDMPF